MFKFIRVTIRDTCRTEQFFSRRQSSCIFLLTFKDLCFTINNFSLLIIAVHLRFDNRGKSLLKTDTFKTQEYYYALSMAHVRVTCHEDVECY